MAELDGGRGVEVQAVVVDDGGAQYGVGWLNIIYHLCLLAVFGNWPGLLERQRMGKLGMLMYFEEASPGYTWLYHRQLCASSSQKGSGGVSQSS